MSLGGISLWQLLIVLLIIILLFGTNKLRSLGGDLGNAIKNFRRSMQEGEQTTDTENDQIIQQKPPPQTKAYKSEKDEQPR